MRNTGKQSQRNVKADAAHCILGCFVKSFYFVWCESVCSCQECSGEAVAVAWCLVGVAKVAVRIAIGRRVVGNVNVMSTSECRPIVWVKVYGVSIWISPIQGQFDRCPSWLVHQWKQKRFWVFWVVLIPAIVTRSWERKEKELNVNSNIVLVLTAKPPV